MKLAAAGLWAGLFCVACTPTPPARNVGGRSGSAATGGSVGMGSVPGTGGSDGTNTNVAGSNTSGAGGVMAQPSGSGGGSAQTGGTAGPSGAGGTGGASAASDAASAPGDDGPNTIGDVMASVDALPPPPSIMITYPAIMPCATKASIDRLTAWNSHAGTMRPTGSLLTKDAGKDIVKVDFMPGSAWHEVVVPVANSLSAKADLSKAKGMTLTYSSTADFQVQLRPLSHAHGSAQYTAMFPSTGGMVKELTLPFTEPTWGAFLGKPTFPISVALSDANFFNFIGRPAVANSITIRGLRIDGYTPACN